MPAQLDPIKRYKCTYENCVASFDTEKEMKRHKKNNPDHDYCSKCDEDFENWDDFTAHKIYRPDKHHTACRICGDEFKSVSGMKRHVEISHPVNQQITCIGCGEIFKRAAHLMEHIEFGHCKKISAQEFAGHIQHKNIIYKILNKTEEYDSFKHKIGYHEAAQDDDQGGGVSVSFLDTGIENEQAIMQKPIEPTIEPEARTPIHRVGEAYPALPSAKPCKDQSGVDTESLASNFGRTSISGSSVTAVDVDSNTRSISASVAGSAAGPPQPEWDIDTTQKLEFENPWGEKAIAKTLFPHAMPTPPPPGWRGIAKSNDQNIESEHGINVFRTRFWDPSHPNYLPERFFNPVIQRYMCPFPRCQQDFDVPISLEAHIMAEHRLTAQRCPHCLKLFKSTTALVAHCEAPNGRCKIRHTDKFNIFLDRASGGFLGAESLTRADYKDVKTVMVENEEGKMVKHTPPTTNYTQFSATHPSDWKPNTSGVAKKWGPNRG